MISRGEHRYNAILTAQQVEEIRTLYAAGDITQAILASRYGVSRHTIANVLSYRRWTSVGGPRHTPPGRSTPERFWSKVARHGEECWIWSGAVGRGGYGQYYPTYGRQVLAHRMAYELTTGPIPPQHDLHHLCGNKLCVNPAHLALVSHATHWSIDEKMFAHMQTAKTHCANGHEFTPENTYLHRGTWRRCRQCVRDRQRARYYRNKSTSTFE